MEPGGRPRRRSSLALARNAGHCFAVTAWRHANAWAFFLCALARSLRVALRIAVLAKPRAARPNVGNAAGVGGWVPRGWGAAGRPTVQ